MSTPGGDASTPVWESDVPSQRSATASSRSSTPTPERPSRNVFSDLDRLGSMIQDYDGHRMMENEDIADALRNIQENIQRLAQPMQQYPPPPVSVPPMYPQPQPYPQQQQPYPQQQPPYPQQQPPYPQQQQPYPQQQQPYPPQQTVYVPVPQPYPVEREREMQSREVGSSSELTATLETPHDFRFRHSADLSRASSMNSSMSFLSSPFSLRDEFAVDSSGSFLALTPRSESQAQWEEEEEVERSISPPLPPPAAPQRQDSPTPWEGSISSGSSESSPSSPASSPSSSSLSARQMSRSSSSMSSKPSTHGSTTPRATRSPSPTVRSGSVYTSTVQSHASVSSPPQATRDMPEVPPGPTVIVHPQPQPQPAPTTIIQQLPPVDVPDYSDALDGIRGDLGRLMEEQRYVHGLVCSLPDTNSTSTGLCMIWFGHVQILIISLFLTGLGSWRIS